MRGNRKRRFRSRAHVDFSTIQNNAWTILARKSSHATYKASTIIPHICSQYHKMCMKRKCSSMPHLCAWFRLKTDNRKYNRKCARPTTLNEIKIDIIHMAKEVFWLEFRFSFVHSHDIIIMTSEFVRIQVLLCTLSKSQCRDREYQMKLNRSYAQLCSTLLTEEWKICYY